MTRQSVEVPVGRCFVSYAYGDEDAVGVLQRMDLGDVDLELFEPIDVPPSQMVSDELIASIRACDSLIFVDTDRSRQSPWVTLETDYARRNQKPVFRFRSDPGRLETSLRSPLDLPVYSGYVRENQEQVAEISRFMRLERNFDVFLDVEDIAPGANWADTMNQESATRLDRGGYLVVFWSAAANESFPPYLREEIASGQDNVVWALLDETMPPRSLHLEAHPVVPLALPGTTVLDRRRLDDLIVWIYWLCSRIRGPDS